MPHPSTYHFRLPRSRRPSEIVLDNPWYPGVQPFWPNCTTRRSVDPIDGIVAVVIHATAGSSSAGAVSVMKKTTDPASFHWLVPDEDEPQHGQFVWACVPEAKAAWHVRNAAFHDDVNDGAKRINHWSLGIEVVNLQRNDPFSAWQVEATARIVRYCWAKYPNLVHVVSHAKLDSGRRTDPGIDFDWERFKALTLTSEQEDVRDLVAAATPLGRIRNGPTTSSCCDVA
jgi:N-acetyl-anhydromuramyl-L-alanine amidase AmpD